MMCQEASEPGAARSARAGHFRGSASPRAGWRIGRGAVTQAARTRLPGACLGTLCETEQVYLSHHAREVMPMVEQYLADERDRQLAEVALRKQLFRQRQLPARATGRSVIVTDDGIATGATMIAGPARTANVEPARSHRGRSRGSRPPQDNPPLVQRAGLPAYSRPIPKCRPVL